MHDLGYVFFWTSSFNSAGSIVSNSSPAKKRAGHHSLGHWWLVHSLLLDYADAHASAGCVSITSKYTDVKLIYNYSGSQAGDELTRLAWVCNRGERFTIRFVRRSELIRIYSRDRNESRRISIHIAWS